MAQEKAIEIQGPAGVLEGRLAEAEQTQLGVLM